MFGEDTDWAYPGDAQATLDEGWSAPPLVKSGEWVEVEGPYGPTFWSEMLGRALQPHPAAPVVAPQVQEESVSLWVWLLGGISVAVAIRVLR